MTSLPSKTFPIYSDIIKRIDKANEIRDYLGRNKAKELALEEFWRIARMTDADLILAFNSISLNYDQFSGDAILSEFRRRRLKEAQS